MSWLAMKEQAARIAELEKERDIAISRIAELESALKTANDNLNSKPCATEALKGDS